VCRVKVGERRAYTDLGCTHHAPAKPKLRTLTAACATGEPATVSVNKVRRAEEALSTFGNYRNNGRDSLALQEAVMPTWNDNGNTSA